MLTFYCECFVFFLLNDSPNSSVDKTPIEKHTNKSESPDNDIHKDARGKISHYPISVEDIRKCSKDNVDNVEFMTKYSQFDARKMAAQEFLINHMHFQSKKIKIHTLKIATSWSSNTSGRGQLLGPTLRLEKTLHTESKLKNKN